MSFVPLTQAVTSGDASAVSAALANGADVNERTGGGQTPLILATIFGHTRLIPILLEAGADPSLRDSLGLNATDWAQRRGATEAIELFNNKRPRAGAQSDVPKPRQRDVPIEAIDEREALRPVSDAEKGQRWLAGLKQRIAEQSQREDSGEPNIFRAQPEPQTDTSSHESEEAFPEFEEPAVPSVTQTVEAPAPRRKPSRKRCPKCNAIYNSDLVAYCAHHIVPLVDADELPIISEPTRQGSPVLFWTLIVITLTGSIVVGSLITRYFYRADKPAAQVASSSTGPGGGIQKGTPTPGPELEGKVVTLPTAECPLKGQEPIPGTVTVKVAIAKNGQVKSARAFGGDWLLRGAATEAAMKSTFSPEKLRGRETEGTITYTFGP